MSLRISFMMDLREVSRIREGILFTRQQGWEGIEYSKGLGSGLDGRGVLKEVRL